MAKLNGFNYITYTHLGMKTSHNSVQITHKYSLGELLKGTDVCINKHNAIDLFVLCVCSCAAIGLPFIRSFIHILTYFQVGILQISAPNKKRQCWNFGLPAIVTPIQIE